jgi:hypothetical protein
MLAKRDSKVRQALLTVMARQSLYRMRTASDYHEMARNGFRVLGRVASPAEPGLAMLRKDDDPEISATAAAALSDVEGWIGSDF